MTALAPFDFAGQQVRVVTDEHGEPWFMAADVASILEMGNVHSSLALLDEDERALHTVEGRPGVSIVSESGLYSLVLRSRKPEAKAFKRWITREVLPAIRKTGGYGSAMANPAELTRADLARMVLAAEEELAVTSAALTAAQPAIEYHERFVITDDVVTVKVWGQQFGLTEQQAYQLLRDKKIVYRVTIGERWSSTRQRRETVYEYRPYAGRQSFAWFDLRPQHNAPRHHNGQVRQTLYVRQAYALDLAKVVGLVDRTQIDGAA